MVTEPNSNQSTFNTSVNLIDKNTSNNLDTAFTCPIVPPHIELPISVSAPLFVVGPNGVGKSGLIHNLYTMNREKAVRISAHRQTWMNSNAIPFSPQQKNQSEEQIKNSDNQLNARWTEQFPEYRVGLVVAALIDSVNTLARNVYRAVKNKKHTEATNLTEKSSPLDIISELFVESGIPIKLSISNDNAIVASKNDGPEYSIAALSDGERAALLIAGTILTAKEGALILVDEPERHLHASIVTPLLLQLFSQRPDCAFVISTHELSLPVSCTGSRTALVRDSEVFDDNVHAWDIDLLEAGVDIDDATKEAIIGSRRKMLFIEGDENSLDKPIYELLFPGVTIFPRSTCRNVEHAVTSVNDTSEVSWVKAYGIVDQDQLTTDKKTALEAKKVFPLSVYSVEGLYYNPKIVATIAKRQCDTLGDDPDKMVATAKSDLLDEIAKQKEKLAARMAEQAVRDQIGFQVPTWKDIHAGRAVNISVDAQKIYNDELKKLQDWLDDEDVSKIIERYPIRETGALSSIAAALLFKNRNIYEKAVRKLARDDDDIKDALLGHFGTLPDKIVQ